MIMRCIGDQLSHANKLCLAIAFFAALAVPLSHAQLQTEPNLSFEVASIKLNARCDDISGTSITPSRLNLPCISLRALIRMAYGRLIIGGNINARQIEVLGGPSWIDVDRYEVSAKADGKASTEQMIGPMLRALLEERFQVKVHQEFRDGPVYELTVVTSNPNLKPTKEGSCTPRYLTTITMPKPGELGKVRYCGSGPVKSKDGLTIMDLYGVSMPEFAGLKLFGEAERPVIDRTGLAGRFDIHLEFVRNRLRSGGTVLNGVAMPEAQIPPDDAAGPSIFTALKEQLGLRLSPANGPLEVIVIDKAAKPSPN